VLAGGLGRRLGQSKGELIVAGQPLALRAARILAPLCRSVRVSVRRQTAAPAAGLVTIEDADPPGRGPLAGIDAAFATSAAGDLLVLACDYPHATTALVAGLLARATPESDLVFPCDALGTDHPLIGLWRRRLQGPVREALREGRYRVLDLLPRVRVLRVLEEDPRLLLNLNEPADLERL
jgi:molybdopterin-guanine dinucleotide biosynthesis protein A